MNCRHKVPGLELTVILNPTCTLVAMPEFGRFYLMQRALMVLHVLLVAPR
jgi:hypothetical protein